MTEGLLPALVADVAPSNLHATAFGVFDFASGIALLLASLTAGFLWEVIGPAVTLPVTVAPPDFSLLCSVTRISVQQWPSEKANFLLKCDPADGGPG